MPIKKRRRAAVLKAFDRLYEQVKNNKKFKFEVLTAQLKQIEGEKKAFKDSNLLPDEPKGRRSPFDAAVKTYVKAMSTAREKCMNGYKKAVSQYREQGEIARASLVQEEMKVFLSRTSASLAPAIKEGELLATAEIDPRPWLYTTVKPAPGWTAPRFDTSNWAQGNAAFGMPDAPNIRIGTLWNTPAIALRTWVDVPELKPNHLVILRLRHDEGVKIYLNGELLFHDNGWNNEYADIVLDDAQKALFRPGRNTLAVTCVNAVGYGGVDMGLRLVLKK